MSRTAEQHPPSLRARVARSGRVFYRFRGWQRLVHLSLPERLTGSFIVSNGGTVFSGDLSSYIDRQTYLFGQYEDDSIRLFLEQSHSSRRGTLLDVGANAGTHSTVFGRHFATVHSFEPNPALWTQFVRNVELNALSNVHLHRVGLSDAPADLPFHVTGIDNHGLGTFVTTEQYSVPLKRIGSCRVERGDEFLEQLGVESIDGLKIDVQGFEPNVLRGLRRLLERSRPTVWFELGAGTQGLNDLSSLQRLFPYAIRALKLTPSPGLLSRRTTLEEVTGTLPEGDYFVLPL